MAVDNYYHTRLIAPLSLDLNEWHFVSFVFSHTKNQSNIKNHLEIIIILVKIIGKMLQMQMQFMMKLKYLMYHYHTMKL